MSYLKKYWPKICGAVIGAGVAITPLERADAAGSDMGLPLVFVVVTFVMLEARAGAVELMPLPPIPAVVMAVLEIASSKMLSNNRLIMEF